jgi:O-antigen/teichoic acid export membrane protein
MRRLALGAGASIAIKVSYAILSAAATALLARYLGAAALGQYTFLIALIAVLSLPAQAGVPTLVMRETARLVGVGKAADAWSLWRWGFTRMLFVASVVAIGILVVPAIWPQVLSEYSTLHLVVVALALLVLPLSALRGAALRGLQKVNLGQMPENLIRPATFLLAVAVASLLFRGAADTRMMVVLLSFLLSLVVAAVVGAIWLRRHAPPRVGIGPPPDRAKLAAWSSSLLPLTLLASIGSADLDVLMIGMWLDHAELGIYKVVQQTVIAAGFVPTAINAVFMPLIARMYVSADRAELQQLISRASATLFLALLPVSLALFFFGEPILRFAFGPQFQDGYLALWVLIAGQLINVAAGPVSSVLNMTGHERQTLVATVLSIVLLLASAGPLTARWGVFGAAIAAATATAVANLLMCWFVHRSVGIRTFALNREMPRLIVRLFKMVLAGGRR